MRKTLGIRPTNSVESNPGIRTRGRNPIAGPAPRFSPTRIYPECSARKSRHTRHLHLGGALRIDSLSLSVAERIGSRARRGEASRRADRQERRFRANERTDCGPKMSQNYGEGTSTVLGDLHFPSAKFLLLGTPSVHTLKRLPSSREA